MAPHLLMINHTLFPPLGSQSTSIFSVLFLCKLAWKIPSWIVRNSVVTLNMSKGRTHEFLIQITFIKIAKLDDDHGTGCTFRLLSLCKCKLHKSRSTEVFSLTYTSRGIPWTEVQGRTNPTEVVEEKCSRNGNAQVKC